MVMDESDYEIYHHECMSCGTITKSNSGTLDKETLFEMGSSSCPTLCDDCKGLPKRPLNELLEENCRLKKALKEFLDGERRKLVNPEHLTPFIARFLDKHGLNHDDFK
jgi:hypothetical protein